MTRVKKVSESIVVGGSPEAVYEKISDPRNMGRWSPENTGATFLEGHGLPLTEGSLFWGHNRRGPMRWATYCRVTAAEPGKRFAFEVLGQRGGAKTKPRLPFGIATWEYVLEEAAGGTRVTETWYDDRDSSALGRITRKVDRLVTGGRTFADAHGANMKITLQKLKDEIEAAVSS